MRVLVLGGTRFIGPLVVRELAEAGNDVTIFHRGETEAELPSSVQHVHGEFRELDERLPFFGICFGNQLLGRALGLDTYKLPFGHRGINQPVLDKATGRVEITAHNHGFAVDAPVEGVFESPHGYGRIEVSHVGLNDQVVEGLRALDIPAFSVQYHPEAAAGPHDANYLFDRFRDLVVATLETKKNA